MLVFYGEGEREPVLRYREAILVQHNVKERTMAPLFDSWFVWRPLSRDSATDNGICPTPVLDYGYFCVTSHSWEIPAACLRHPSAAGSHFLSVLPRVSR